MIRDEIMAMAAEAGLGYLLPATGNLPAEWYGSDIKALEKFSALAEVAALERFAAARDKGAVGKGCDQ